MASHPSDPQALRELLEELVSIDSVNPDLAPGAAGEEALAGFVGDWLAERGVEISYQDLGPGRRNVIGFVKGLTSSRSVMLNAHLDTVPAGSMPDPFRPVVRDGRLYGRGAQDMKSGLAVAMAATAAAAEVPLAGDVVFAGVADEEAGSKGTEALLTEWSADCGIVLEPTGHVIAPVHKGFAWFDIETAGVAAHGSDPSSGVDAILAMGAILGELDALSAGLLDREPVGRVGTPSLHASLIDGGSDPSTYPERCHLLVERRTVPGETEEAVTAEMEAAVAAARGRTHSGASATARVSLRLLRDPLATPPDALVSRALERACSLVFGTAEVGAVAFWTDAALMAAAGIPSVVFGPRGKGMHSIEESVELRSVYEVAEVLAAVLEDLCG